MPESKPLITEIGSTRIYNSDAKIEGAEVNLIPDFESQVDEIIYESDTSIKEGERLKRLIMAAHTSSLASIIGEDENGEYPLIARGVI